MVRSPTVQHVNKLTTVKFSVLLARRQKRELLRIKRVFNLKKYSY